MDILANNIATIRARWGMEQTDFAALIGVTRYVVGNWERGRNRPDLETMVRLESLSGFPLADLIGRELIKEEIPQKVMQEGIPGIHPINPIEDIRNRLTLMETQLLTVLVAVQSIQERLEG